MGESEIGGDGWLRRPMVWVAGVPLLASVALCLVPLTRVPGYELATVLCIELAFLGGLPAIALIDQVRRAAGRVDESPRGTAWRIWRAAFAADVILCVPAVLASAASAGFTSPCSPWIGLPFCGVLIPASAAVASAVGLLAGFATRSPGRAVGLYLLAVTLSAVATAWPVIAGPQVFAFNVFAGWFPGPIYDESLHLSSAVVASRVEALLWASLAGALVLSTAGRSMTRERRPSHRAWLVIAALSGALLAVRVEAFPLGLATSTADIARELGGRRETAHFVLHYPVERSRRDVDLLARDVEFRYAEDAAFLGVTGGPKVDAFFYRSAQDKKRLVGAADTDFAKPWLHQLHVQVAGFPDPALRHELAHVLAGPLGAWPFGVPMHAGVIPVAGVIEGVATAADDPVGELTLDQSVRAMRALSLAPDVRTLVGPVGFWAEEPSRAYAVVGSFLRFLVIRRGVEAFHRLYRDGDFAAAYGSPLAQLATEWESYVDAVPIDERGLHLAAAHFNRPSLFRQACAREVAEAREAVEAASAVGDRIRTLELYHRVEALDPGDFGLVQSEASHLRDLGDPSAAEQVWMRVAADAHAPDTERAHARLAAAQSAWERGAGAEARSGFEAVIALGPDAPTVRAAEIGEQALGDPASSSLAHYFRDPRAADALLDLGEIPQSDPAYGSAAYLIGRRLTDDLVPERASSWLERSTPHLFGLPDLAREADRLEVRDLGLILRCDEAERVAQVLDQLDRGTPALLAPDDRITSEWLDRCRYDRDAGHTPVSDEAP